MLIVSLKRGCVAEFLIMTGYLHPEQCSGENNIEKRLGGMHRCVEAHWYMSIIDCHGQTRGKYGSEGTTFKVHPELPLSGDREDTHFDRQKIFF